jgi:hypothetical protein
VGALSRFAYALNRMALEVLVGETIDISSGGERVRLPIPGAGYGGHEVVMSASGRHVALYLFSGQSEFAWELFELEPRLRHVGGLPYVFGVGHPPVFSNDETSLAVVSTTRDIGPDDDDPGSVVVDWAEVRVLSLPDGPISLCEIRLEFDAPPAEREPEYPRVAAVQAGEGVTLELPWGGECRIPLPLPRVFVVRGPT